LLKYLIISKKKKIHPAAPIWIFQNFNSHQGPPCSAPPHPGPSFPKAHGLRLLPYTLHTRWNTGSMNAQKNLGDFIGIFLNFQFYQNFFLKKIFKKRIRTKFPLFFLETVQFKKKDYFFCKFRIARMVGVKRTSGLTTLKVHPRRRGHLIYNPKTLHPWRWCWSNLHLWKHLGL